MNGFRNNPTDALHNYEASQWEAARDAIAVLAAYGPNWDGEGALAAPPELISATFRLLQDLEPINPAPADAYLAPDGTLVLEWHRGPGIVTIANVRVMDHAEIIYRTAGQPPRFDTMAIPPAPGAILQSWPRSEEPFSCLDEDTYGVAA